MAWPGVFQWVVGLQGTLERMYAIPCRAPQSPGVPGARRSSQTSQTCLGPHLTAEKARFFRVDSRAPAISGNVFTGQEEEGEELAPCPLVGSELHSCSQYHFLVPVYEPSSHPNSPSYANVG